MRWRTLTVTVAAVATMLAGLPPSTPARAATVGTITTVAGGVSTGPGSATGMYVAAAAVRDNRAYVADVAHHVVREIDLATGVAKVVAGNGTPGDSGDGGPATAAAFFSPTDLAFDAAGNLFVADSYAGRVRKVDTDGRITTVAGGNGPDEGNGDGGPATRARVSPHALAFDASGNLFVADQDRRARIRRIDTSGIITTVAGGGEPADGVGDGLPATGAHIVEPSALAFDTAGNLFIGEASRIRKLTPLGLISTVTSPDSTTPVFVDYPTSIVVEPDGDLLVAGNDVITRVEQTGEISRFVGPEGGSRPLLAPSDLWREPSGEIFVSDVFYLKRITTAGAVSTVAGNGTYAFTGEGTAATNAELAHPWGVAVGSDGATYVYDAGNGLVRKVSPAGVITTLGKVWDQFDSFGAMPKYPAVLRSGIGVDAAGNVFVSVANYVKKVTPTGVVSTVAYVEKGVGVSTVEADGTVYVVESPGTVLRIDPSGTRSVLLHDLVEPGAPSGVGGLALDGAGNLYVANGDIYKLNLATKAYTRVASLPARLRAYADLAVTAGGTIYYTPTDISGTEPPVHGTPLGGTQIKRIDPEGFVTHIAGAEPRTWGFRGDGGSAKDALFHSISSMALDGAGNLLLADELNHRIRKVDDPGALPRDASAPNVKPRTKAENYVAKAYQVLLNRSPTAAEAASWKVRLAAGGDRAAVPVSIVTSREYRTILVQAAFALSVGRQPSPAETSWGLSALESYPVTILMAALLGTDAAVARHGGSDAPWIRYLHRLVTGREADTASVNYWLQQRAAGTSRGLVAYAFLTWDEAYRSHVGRAYRMFAGREPDAAGMAFWVDQMRRGLRHEYVDAAFVAWDLFYESVPDGEIVQGKT